MIGRWWRKITRRTTTEAMSPRVGSLNEGFDEESSIYGGDPTLGVVDFGQVSICGNFREHNEDSLFFTPANNILPTFIVADGMGGQLGGEKASQLAVEIVPKELQKRFVGAFRTNAVIRAIRESISHANQEILAASLIQPNLTNMGTTIVMTMIRRGRAYVAGIGDSRCYRVRGNRVEQLTRDHSMAQALAEVGTIRQEDVSSHRYNHVLYLYLGSREVDRGITEVKVLALLEGDRYILCSDGLSGVVSEKEMMDILKAEPNAQKSAEKLVDLAVKNKSRDNITCIVVNIGKVDSPPNADGPYTESPSTILETK
jgi:PPM family protein phosphatase